MQRVIHGGQPYIGRERHDIEQNFFDHALIVSLGASILNMPCVGAARRWGRSIFATAPVSMTRTICRDCA
jgi:hypothetical protein